MSKIDEKASEALTPPGDVGELVAELKARVAAQRRLNPNCLYYVSESAEIDKKVIAALQSLSTRLSECEAERDEARRQRDDEIEYSLKRIGAALEDKYAAGGRAERLEAALMPFASVASIFDNDDDERAVSLGRWYPSRLFPDPGEFGADIRYTVADFRRARAALSDSPHKGDE